MSRGGHRRYSDGVPCGFAVSALRAPISSSRSCSKLSAHSKRRSDEGRDFSSLLPIGYEYAGPYKRRPPSVKMSLELMSYRGAGCSFHSELGCSL